MTIIVDGYVTGWLMPSIGVVRGDEFGKANMEFLDSKKNPQMQHMFTMPNKPADYLTRLSASVRRGSEANNAVTYRFEISSSAGKVLYVSDWFVSSALPSVFTMYSFPLLAVGEHTPLKAYNTYLLGLRATGTVTADAKYVELNMGAGDVFGVASAYSKPMGGVQPTEGEPPTLNSTQNPDSDKEDKDIIMVTPDPDGNSDNDIITVTPPGEEPLVVKRKTLNWALFGLLSLSLGVTAYEVEE
jgi:hypothetical protein